MQHKTNELAGFRGVYVSDCKCLTETRVSRGDRFPPCPACQVPVIWHYLRSYAPDGPPPPRTSVKT